MAEPRIPVPALLVVAVFSRHEDVISWAQARLERLLGPVGLASDPFVFDLRDGIFAEVTLRYHAGAFEPWPWTYADYRLPFVHEFLHQAREYYRRRLHEPREADEHP
jgi:hypothetical protein